MQLRKTIWMLTALSAMSLVMTGCPARRHFEHDVRERDGLPRG